MGDKKIIPELIDKRLQERLIDRGEISAEMLTQYLEQLPDLADEVESVSLGGDVEPSAEDEETA